MIQEELGSSIKEVGCAEQVALDGHWVVWVEDDGNISRHPTRASAFSFPIVDDIATSLHPAGRLTVDFANEGMKGLVVYQYDMFVSSPERRLPFVRELAPSAVLPRAPRGSQIVLVTNAEGVTTGVSRLFEIPGAAETILGREDFVGSALVVRFRWNDPRAAEWRSFPKLVLNSGSSDGGVDSNGGFSPDVRLWSSEDGLAIWYDPPIGSSVLEVHSDYWYADPVAITTAEDQITQVAIQLERTASLGVTVRLPGDEDSQLPSGSTVSVRQPGASEALATSSFLTANEGVTFAQLPPKPLEVILDLNGSRLLFPVSLADGGPADVEFLLDPIDVWGTITQAGTAIEGWVQLGDARAESGPDGEFNLKLWRSGRYVMKAGADGSGDSRSNTADTLTKLGFSSTLRIDGDRELDIEIPSNKVVVEVVDRETQASIAGARVGYRNSYLLPEKWRDQDRDAGEQSVSGIVTTDGDGVASLPPLLEGTVQLFVQHERYEAYKGELFNVESAQEIARRVELTSEKAGAEVSLALIDGRAASGAVATALSGVSANAVWTGTADEQGLLVLPDRVKEFPFLVQHEQAGMVIRKRDSSPEADLWILPQKAAPLVIQLQHPDGSPARQGELLLWLGGILFSSSSPTHARPNQEGVVVLSNLPPSQLRLLGLPWGTMIDATSGSIESLAVTVNYPWPASIELTVIP